MANEQPAVLLTSADIDNIENERNRINSELADIEARRGDLEAARIDLSDRLTKIHALLDALGIGTLSQLASNSVYASRNVKVVPRNGTSGH